MVSKNGSQLTLRELFENIIHRQFLGNKIDPILGENLRERCITLEKGKQLI